MPQNILIPAPEGSKYLSEIFNIHASHGPTLPKNCLFDKVKGIADSQAADLREIFEIKDTTLKGSPAYKIVRRL